MVEDKAPNIPSSLEAMEKPNSIVNPLSDEMSPV